MSEIKEILSNLGYKYKDEGKCLRMAAVYRSGDNPSSLVYYIREDKAIDFITGEIFNFEELIRRTLNLEDKNAAKTWLKTKSFNFDTLLVSDKPKIKFPKYYKLEELNNIAPDHSYWINRGISEEVLKKFKGGVWQGDGKLRGRYVFPIFKDGKEDKIVGWAGRSLDSNSKVKWKLLGEKEKWVNFGNNYNAIKESKSVKIIESTGDGISLVMSGVEDVLPLYGLTLSNEKLTFLLKLNPAEIIISLNNDKNKKQNWGNEAAQKVRIRLKRYFNEEKIKIQPPPEGDWNEFLLKHGKEKIKEFFNLVINSNKNI